MSVKKLRTKEEIIQDMCQAWPYKIIGQEELNPYISEAMQIYADQELERNSGEERSVIREINGIKYVIFNTEIGLSQTGIVQAQQLSNKIKYFDGIEISMEYKNSFWGLSKIKVEFLIPENKALSFNKIELRNF